MESKDIRENFLVFFENKDHLRLKSASLIPHDPTLLFTSAGMVPLKAYYLGEEEPPGKRIATVQKCLRTNDIDNVGYTARHHTFFEMLGNFSIGDYFKEEAIPWAYQYVTEVLNLPKDRLWISVYKDDLESKEIWKKVGIAPKKIVSLGEDDNFWKMGTVGPCGPCSEIYFDRGIRKRGEEKQLPGDDGERFLEFWNLVFTQFDRQANGELKPLPKRNIDTGLGLERITSIIEGVETDFETDLFLPIIKKIEDISKEKYGIDGKNDHSFRVIADHIRAISFLIAEGLVPSNEKRGYVLRRLIRRSALFGRELNLEKSFLYRIIPAVVDSLNVFYPELSENKDKIIFNVKSEEERFNLTLNGGFEYFKDQRKKIEASGGKEFSADAVFYLYDTLGFPIELTKLLLKEHNLNFNNEKFDEYLEEQRERARKAF
ncbi:MAG: alanine--tRNA ligase, partial [Caldisericaceae bacterium]|nr:alanine--tRNA ligase [Caldisericaceae bacterium]